MQTHNSLKIGTLVRWVPDAIDWAGSHDIPKLGIVIQLPPEDFPNSGYYRIAWTISKPTNFTPGMVDSTLHQCLIQIVR